MFDKSSNRPAFAHVVTIFGLVAVAIWLFGCNSQPSGDRPAVRFDHTTSPHGDEPFPNWPAPPHVIENQVRTDFNQMNFELIDKRRTAKGTGGAQNVNAFFSSIQKEIRFKWKEAIKGTLDGSNNSPRREIAAYHVQKLFLSPEDYVVPTSYMHCEPLLSYARDHVGASATVSGTQCVLGKLSLWLKNVEHAVPLYEEARFLEEPSYAYFMSNLNVLTYLIRHRDAREGNFIVSKDHQRPQVFSIDNGISFKAFPYNFVVKNWDVIRVPAVRRDSIERLRALERGDLDRLGVLAQLEKNRWGRLIDVPPGENIAPGQGVRVQGGTVQFGLTKAEIGQLWERIQALIGKVDRGDLPVF